MQSIACANMSIQARILREKKEAENPCNSFFSMVDICRYDEQNKLETKKKHAADLSLRAGSESSWQAASVFLRIGGIAARCLKCSSFPCLWWQLVGISSIPLVLALWPWTFEKKKSENPGGKMYRCCLVHNAKYCKCCQISKLSPALNSPLPSVFSRPCISLISHLIQISFDLLHQIIISLLYPPSFRMLPGPLLFHHPHLHPLPLLPRPSSGCFGYMVKGC